MSRAGKAGAALVLALLVAVAGCGPERPRREVELPDEPVDGYAYTAMLISRHPLWGALRELERAIDDLGDDEWDPVLEPIDRRFEEIAFIENFALADPEARMSVLRSNWRANYPPLLLRTEGLADDLEARIEWEGQQADRMVQRRMARARSEESRRLAQMRAALVSKYQERLTNLSIQATLRQDEAAAAAEAERERVWRIIEEQMREAREAGEQELAQLERQLRAQTSERVESARERAREASAEREQTLREAGAGLHGQMIEQMQQPWTTPQIGQVEASATADPANERVQEMGFSREAAEAARQEKMRQQRERMLEAVGRLRAQVKAGTETAAKVVAYRNGIRLHVIPGGQRLGDNVTGEIAEQLEEFWTGGGQRS